jgi:hypothetical protein
MNQRKGQAKVKVVNEAARHPAPNFNLLSIGILSSARLGKIITGVRPRFIVARKPDMMKRVVLLAVMEN